MSDLKLTEKMEYALRNIAESPTRSGGFWRDLGVSPSTIARLEDLGLVDAVWRPATGETSIIRRSWRATKTGISLLESSK